MKETIAAISSFGVQNAISIVRICGGDAYKIATTLSRKVIYPKIATLCQVYSSKNEHLDEAIIIYFKAPNSFNGEDIVEIQCHGGKIVAKLILQSVLELGARQAEQGEFTKIAILNHKIDLAKAEAIATLINASNEKSAKLLARQLRGSMSRFVHQIRENLLEILAYCEVNIDYAEEDLPLDIVETMENKVQKILIILQDTLLSSRRRSSLFGELRISIIGKPNVGKSSLLNALLEYERAIVSDIAGTTRDTVEEVLSIGEYSVRIVDTAGIRNSDNEIENIGIKYSLRAFEDSDIVLALFDGSRKFDHEDKNILDILKSDSSKMVLAIITKSDLKQELDFDILREYETLKISIKKSCSELEQKIKTMLDLKYSDDQNETLVNERQINACEASFENVKKSIQFLKSGELEIFAFHLREAIESIGSITNCYDNEEMLDKMFESFCVGK